MAGVRSKLSVVRGKRLKEIREKLYASCPMCYDFIAAESRSHRAGHNAGPNNGRLTTDHGRRRKLVLFWTNLGMLG